MIWTVRHFLKPGQRGVWPDGGREQGGAVGMIEAVNLTKRFDSILAVDHISATIRTGSVFGLIGTNGAGKSTFLRMAAGVLKPDEGTSYGRRNDGF